MHENQASTLVAKDKVRDGNSSTAGGICAAVLELAH